MNPISEPGGGEVPAPNTAATEPQAAQVVVSGDKTEREVQLEKDLEQELGARKKIESDNAQLQDELHRLTAPPSTRVPPAAPKERPSCRRGPLGVRTN